MREHSYTATMERNNTVHAVQTTFALLEALQALGGAGVTRLADWVGVPKSTAHNHLSTLREDDWVVKTISIISDSGSSTWPTTRPSGSASTIS